MVKVRALQTCFVGNKLRAAGSVFDHNGVINDSVLVALEDETPTKVPKQAKRSKAAIAGGVFPTGSAPGPAPSALDE